MPTTQAEREAGVDDVQRLTDLTREHYGRPPRPLVTDNKGHGLLWWACLFSGAGVVLGYWLARSFT